MTQEERPMYRGIRTHRDPQGRFEFRYPKGWQRYELSEDRDGVMYSPDAEDPQTWFAVWAVRLQDAVVAEDVEILREGIDEGIWQLPGLHIESASEDIFDNLIRFKRVYTFCQDGATRKRKVWMIYVHTWLFVLVAQGADVQAYDRWSIMLDDCLNTFDLSQVLWFASDRELGKDLA